MSQYTFSVEDEMFMYHLVPCLIHILSSQVSLEVLFQSETDLADLTVVSISYQGDHDSPGIIPLAIKDVFSMIQDVSLLVLFYMFRIASFIAYLIQTEFIFVYEQSCYGYMDD